MKRNKKVIFHAAVAVIMGILIFGQISVLAIGTENPVQAPDLNTGTDADVFPFNLLTDFLQNTGIEGATTTVELILLLTVLTLVPSILIMMTSFTRIVIILSFTRNAMGTQQTPPNQVIIGLSIFLTYFTMYVPFNSVMNDAWKPYSAGEITVDEAFDKAVTPLRNFMYEQIRLQEHEAQLKTFMVLARMDMPNSLEEIPTYVLIPSFIVSEVTTAFKIGFYIFIPFIVIDMVVASALMSMGMMMLPPVMISLPFKIMLFVMIDGWNLVVTSIIKTFTG